MTDREPQHVEPTALTCAQVDERDLEAEYVAGRLGEGDAEAFEAHVFTCDRCWPLLEAALAVAAVRRQATAGGRVRQWPRFPLAAAAALVAVVASTWWIVGRSPPAMETLRGSADSVTLLPRATAEGIGISFARQARADVYRVRVFTEDGELVAERETPDTTLEISQRTDPRLASSGPVLIEVTALDRLREPVASSGLVRLNRPAPDR